MIHSRSERSRTASIALLVVSCAICLGASEFVVRRVEVSRSESLSDAGRDFVNRMIEERATESTEALYSLASAGKRYVFKPNLRWSQVVGNDVIYWYTNSFGMRWREVQVTKAPGVKRVAFVGDSFTAGAYSRDHSTSFVGIVDSLLDRSLNEVLNFGVNGYGIHEMHEHVVQEVSQFDPDVIVLAFFNGNDFRDTFFGFDSTVTPEGALTRITPLSADVAGEPEPSDLHEGSNYLWVRGALSRDVQLGTIYRFLEDHPGDYGSLVDLEPAQPNRRNTAAREMRRLPSEHLDFKAINQFNYYTYWSRRDDSPVAREAFQEVLSYLNQIRLFCADRGIQFILISIPFQEQVTTTHPDNEVYNISLPQAHLEAWAEETGVPYLDLLPVFRNLDPAAQEAAYVTGDGHWSPAGHLLGGRAMAEFLGPLVGSTDGESRGHTLTDRLLNGSALARLTRVAYYRLSAKIRAAAGTNE